MSIETDESLWPEGAQWYGPETKYHNACFYKQDEDGHWWICFGKTVSAWSLTGPNVPSKRDDLIPRPSATWPQVGVECEYSLYDGDTWKACKIIGTYEDFIWVKDHSGVWTSFSKKIRFRPIRTPRDELIDVVTKAARVSNDTMFSDAVDAILAKYELKEKTK